MADKLVLRAMAIAAAVSLTACGQADLGSDQTTSIRQDMPRFVSTLSRRFREEVRNVINFDFDVDRLDAEGLEIAAEQAAWILRHPNVRFAVIGHTDKVGSNAYNIDLGMRRAQNVVAALIAEGVSETQLIAMVTEGEEMPLIDTEDRERANRRTVTEVLGFIEQTATVVTDDDDDDDDNPPPPPPPPPGPPAPTDEFGNPIPIDDGPVLQIPDRQPDDGPPPQDA